MKKMFHTFFTVLLLFCGIGIFIFFELPPFHPGGPIFPEKVAVKPSTENQAEVSQEEQAAAAKIDGNKTFTEYMKIGAAAFISKDYVLAKVAFTQAVQKSPQSADAAVMLARTYIARREPGEAQRILSGIQTPSPTTIYYRGLMAAYTGDHEGAKTLFRQINSEKAQKILAAYSEFDAYQNGANEHLKTLLGRSFTQVEEYDLAIPTLLDVIKQDKNYRDAWTLLGYSYLKTEKYQDAIQSLEEARKLDPTKPEPAFYLGLSYLSFGDLQKAAESLEIAKRNNYQPAVQVEQKLADIYLQLQRFEESAASYEAVVALNSEEMSYFITPVWIYLDKLHEPEKALALAQKAAAAHPDNAMSYNLLGWASIEMNLFAEAQKNLDKARSLNPTLDAVYLNYGLLAEKRAQYDRAVGYYRQAYDLGKDESGQENSIGVAAAQHYNNLIKEIPALNGSELMVSTLTAP